MIVYRVEHDTEQTGPFNCHTKGYDTSMLREVAGHSYWDKEYPTTQQDGIYMHQPECGVANLQQLDHWFPPRVRRALHVWGFKLRVFYAKRAECGDYQVGFKRGDAVLVGEHPLTDLPDPDMYGAYQPEWLTT